MKTDSKYDQDSVAAYMSITEATDDLETKMPSEMIMLVLLRKTLEYAGGFTDIAQWETVKSELLDIRDQLITDVELYWSNEIDSDKVAEMYDERYG